LDDSVIARLTGPTTLSREVTMYLILTIFFILTSTNISAAGAGEQNWYWMPEGRETQCKVADYSPAFAFAKLSILGAKIVDLRNGSMVVVVVPDETMQLADQLMPHDKSGYYHIVFFRSEQSCMTYIEERKRRKEEEQRQYERNLEKYK
jgi:hypothetical protein